MKDISDFVTDSDEKCKKHLPKISPQELAFEKCVLDSSCPNHEKSSLNRCYSKLYCTVDLLLVLRCCSLNGMVDLLSSDL